MPPCTSVREENAKSKDKKKDGTVDPKLEDEYLTAFSICFISDEDNLL